ncbi:hypothetical protein [Xylanibacter oryzae]|uniref:hypothetical protein n=1 Tax=Xylanibacter oryzae TaxID=185293 RepID=UPI0004ACC78C|nr:hypothetical protein [Xylanibacter oryzae]
MFNFFSNTYTFVITIFAAMFGMAFPLILQSIQRIDEKYNSEYLTKQFYDENIFKSFKTLLIIFACLICLSHFILGDFTSYIFLYYAQSFFLGYIVFLVILLILLFNKISIYYNVDSLFSYLEKNMTKDNCYAIFDILKFAYKKGKEYIYKKSVSVICKYFQKEQEKAKSRTYVVYSDFLYDILSQISVIIKNTDKQLTHLDFSNIVDTILTVNNKFISNRTYLYLFFILKNASTVENTILLQRYWKVASSYYINNFEGLQSNDDTQEHARTEFYHFNIMLGTLYVYKKQYPYLKYIINFTQTFPESYPLIPGTIKEITDTALYFSEDPYSFFKFNMFDSDIGINADEDIENQLYHYLSLLFIRLWSIDYYNAYNSSPLEEPLPANNIDKNEACIRCMKTIKKFVSEWYKSDKLKAFSLSQVPEEATVVKLIDSNIENLNEKNNEIINRDSYDKNKLQNIYNNLIYYNALPQSDLFTTTDSESTNKKEFNIGSCEKLEKRCLKKECDDENPFIGKILSTRLEYIANSKCIYQLFNSFEYETKPIKYTELEQKLASKKLTTDDCIIDISRNINFETDANIYIVGNCNIKKCLFICKKKDMPSFCIEKTSFTNTNGETSIYPNGKQLIGPNGEELIDQNEKIFIEPKEIDKYNHLYAYVTKSDDISYKIYAVQTITMESPIVEKPHGTLIIITG